MLRFGGDPHVHAFQVGDEPVVLGGLKNDEIGGLAATLEKTSAGRGVVGRGQQLDERAVASRQYGVIEAELGQSSSARRFHAKDAAIEVGGLGEVAHHHGDLAQLVQHGR